MRKFTLFLCAVFLTMIGYSQGHETFDDFDSPGSSYEDGSFTGQDGSTWEYLQARGDGDAEIDDGDTALMLGRNRTPDAELTSGTLENGIETLSFTYMQAFSNDVDLEVHVNDDLIYTATSDDQEGEAITTDDISVEVEGDFTLKFSNPDGGQVNIDDIIWTEASGGGDDCVAVDVPFTQDFEEVTTPDIPNCGSLETNVGDYSGDGWYTSNETSYGFSSNVLAHKWSSSGSPDLDDWYFTQGINLEANVNYQISFKYGSNSTLEEKLKVAFGTSPASSAMDDPSSEIVDLTFEMQGSDIAEETFQVDQDGVYYFGFQIHSGANKYYIYVDDIAIDVAPTCIHTTGLALDNITTDSGDISWIAGDDETDWEILYGEADFDMDSEGTSVDVMDDPNTTLDNLEDDTTYDVYVRAVCSENDKSTWEGPLNFSTNCFATDVPFTQDFEDVTTPDIPNCASLETNNGDGWNTSEVTSYGFDSNVLRHKYTGYAGGPVDAWYFTQGINLETGVDYQISFKYGNNSTYSSEKLKVAYGLSAESSAMAGNEIVDFDDINEANAEVAELIFNVSQDGVYYFGFQSHADESQNYVYVDDIHIDVAPTCLHTTDLTVDNTTIDGANISWTAGDDETDWEVLYGEADFDMDSEGTSVEVTDATIALDELDDDTSYDVYVRAVCSENDKSDWEGPVSFTTNCLATDVPFTQGFEDVTVPDIPNCASLETLSGADWKTASNTTFGSNVLNHTYDSTDDLDAWYFTQGINLETGVDYQISYKYTNNSTTWTEKLKVAYGTSSTADAMTEELADHDAISTTDILLNEESFSVDSDGVYYFGFQAHSIANQNQIYVDDISIIELSECADATAGTPEEAELTVCAGVPFTIAVNGASTEDEGAGGLIGHWEFSTDEGDSWTAIEDATGPSYVVEDGIDDPTYFRYEVTCANIDETDVSDVITVTLNPGNECYCTPTYSTGCGSGDSITNVSLTGETVSLDNDSECSEDAYGDYTDLTPADLAPGETYTLSVSTDYITPTSEQVRAWVDYNGDGQFSEDEEIANSNGDGLPDGTGTFDFTVPDDLDPGNYRMRVRLGYGSTAPTFDACSSASWGEAEDYTVEITGDDIGDDCVNPTDIVVDEIDDSSATVSWTSGEDETQWEVLYDEAGFDPDTDGEVIPVSDMPETILDNLEEDTAYDVYVRAVCGDEDYSDWAGPETFNTEVGSSSYCDIDADGVTVEEITAVDFGGTNITNENSDDVLIDKTDTVVDVITGGTYTLEVEGNTNGSFDNDIVAFIDWNQNLVLDDDGEIFEVGTLVNSTGDDGTSVSLEITIPEDAVLGTTRIRITKTYTDLEGDGGAPPSPALINPCAIEFDAFGMGANPGFGQALDFTLNIEESGGGDDDQDCGQGDDSNDFFGALQIGTGTDFENADDFLVSAGNTLNIQTISLNILAEEPIDQIEFIFYDDDNGAPGDVLPQSVTNSPDAEHQVHIGVAFGYNVYQVYVDVDLDFEGGADGASYWMQPVGEAAGDVDGGAFWEITSEGSLGEPIHGREAGGPWVADEDGSQGVFKLYCEQTDPPEAPILSCDFEIILSVEPMTRVVFSNIDNTSDATIDGSPGLEDFTDIEGYVEQGTPYDIALEGNTNGAYNSYFTVFIDYSGEDQGEFSEFDMFEIGSITNSDGMDGQQATGTITLDESVPDGSYTMRIIKTYGVDATESPTNPCGIYSWGQAEDYTLVVGELSVENHDFENFTFYPNPVQNKLILKAGEQIESVAVYNLLGQEVINVKPNTLQTQVDVDHLQAGVYLMNVTVNGTQKSFRIIKK